jgi:hypothetical protein
MTASFKTLGILARAGVQQHARQEIAEIKHAIAHDGSSIWQLSQPDMRVALLITPAGVGISLLLLGGAFMLESFEGPWGLILVLVYVGSFAVAMGPVVWVAMSEIFPTRIRDRTPVSIAWPKRV